MDVVDCEVVDGENAIFVGGTFIASSQPVQPHLDQRIVHYTIQERPVTCRVLQQKFSLHPREGTLCSGSSRRNARCWCLRIGLVASTLQFSFDGHALRIRCVHTGTQ